MSSGERESFEVLQMKLVAESFNRAEAVDDVRREREQKSNGNFE